MKSLGNIFIIARKELKSLFDSPVAYIVLIAFLLVWQFFFFKSFFLSSVASLRELFGIFPWLSLILIPAVTMGSVSQEKNEGTLELLLTHPLKEWELVIGKFLGNLLFVSIALLFVFPLAISLSPYGDFDWGVIIGQLLAAFSMSAVLVALGIFISSLLKSQIAALLLTALAALGMILIQLDYITSSLPFVVSNVLQQLSVQSHFDSMARGVIDSRDLFYFISTLLVFLSLAWLQLIKRKYGENRSVYRSWKTGIILVIAIVIVVDILGNRLPGRIDLTENNLYTLSPATRESLENLDDIVNITLYVSDELPAQIKPVRRDTEDILKDYQSRGRGNIRVKTVNPTGDADLEAEAMRLGIQKVQFNIYGFENVQLSSGYLGLAISHAGENETIPFIQNPGELEYKITGAITKLTNDEKKKVVVLGGHGEKSLATDYQTFADELRKQFDVEEFSFEEPKTNETENEVEPAPAAALSLPDDTGTLIIAGPTEEIPETQLDAIRAFIDNGGSVLLLVDTVSVMPQLMMANASPSNLTELAKEYGITVNDDLVYDLQAREMIRVGGGPFSLITQYPFWIRAQLAENAPPIFTSVGSFVLPWSSSITLDDAKLAENGLTASVVYQTTDAGGTQGSGAFDIDPQSQPKTENLGLQTVAVSAAANTGKRLIVIGDSDFLAEQMLSPENLSFGLNAVGWLTQENSLAAIRMKESVAGPLQFEDETTMRLIRYGNLAFVVLIPVIFGVSRLTRRRSLRKHTFSSKA